MDKQYSRILISRKIAGLDHQFNVISKWHDRKMIGDENFQAIKKSIETKLFELSSVIPTE